MGYIYSRLSPGMGLDWATAVVPATNKLAIIVITVRFIIM